MKRLRNNWFDAADYERATRVIHGVAEDDPSNWLGHSESKYIMVRIDMRTGDFILLDLRGNIIEDEVLYDLFPSLKD